MKDYDQIFESSYARVIGAGTGITEKGSAFFSRFYEKFLAKSPEIEELFSRTDMDEQVSMLQKSFYAVTSMYVTRTVDDRLFKIAESHSVSGYNVRPPLYDLWLDAIIDTVREQDSEFDSDVELAWRLALSPGIVLMKHHYTLG